MQGDATLFARQDVVEAAWAVRGSQFSMRPSQPLDYEPGSWGPPEADRLVQDVGGWNTPRATEPEVLGSWGLEVLRSFGA